MLVINHKKSTLKKKIELTFRNFSSLLCLRENYLSVETSEFLKLGLNTKKEKLIKIRIKEFLFEGLENITLG